MRFIAIFIIILFLPLASHAMSPEDLVRDYRKEAASAAERKKPEEVLKWLEKAAAEAEHIKKPYARENQLRYIAQQYALLGFKDKARDMFTNAMHSALAATPWYRKQSAVIGVLELEADTKDAEYARLHAIQAIEAGLLEEVDSSGKAGETGRFYKALDKSLTYGDVAHILARMLDWKAEDTRIKTLYSLHKLTLLDEAIAEGWSGKLQPKSLEEPHAKSGPFEQVMWRCMVARIYAHSGNIEAAKMQLMKADGLVRALNENRDKAKDIFDKTREKLAAGK